MVIARKTATASEPGGVGRHEHQVAPIWRDPRPCRRRDSRPGHSRSVSACHVDVWEGADISELAVVPTVEADERRWLTSNQLTTASEVHGMPVGACGNNRV